MKKLHKRQSGVVSSRGSPGIAFGNKWPESQHGNDKKSATGSWESVPGQKSRCKVLSWERAWQSTVGKRKRGEELGE